MMFWFLLGLIYGNIVEYVIHRYIFHGLGKKKKSIFSFHMVEHHVDSKRNNFYVNKFLAREFVGIFGLFALHLPIIFLSAGFYLGLVTYGVLFSVLHNVIHIYPKIGKKYFWWHWNHHMSKQNMSWGVVLPLTDIVTGTLEKRQQSN